MEAKVIKTAQQRAESDGWQVSMEQYRREEIADLRAALASAQEEIADMVPALASATIALCASLKSLGWTAEKINSNSLVVDLSKILKKHAGEAQP